MGTTQTMKRLFPMMSVLLAACGPNAELIRYTVDVEITEVPDWLNPQSAGIILDVPQCTNAEVFDETLRVYDGWNPDAVTAIAFVWTGFDLSDGGDNTETIFLEKGETAEVYAALKPDEVLYEIDHKGNMHQVNKDIAKVKRKSTAQVAYTLGEGIPIEELHTVAKERDLIQFIEEGSGNCQPN